MFSLSSEFLDQHVMSTRLRAYEQIRFAAPNLLCSPGSRFFSDDRLSGWNPSGLISRLRSKNTASRGSWTLQLGEMGSARLS